MTNSTFNKDNLTTATLLAKLAQYEKGSTILQYG